MPKKYDEFYDVFSGWDASMTYSPFPPRLLIPLDKYESQVRDRLPRGRAKKIQVILPPGPSNRQGGNDAAQGCRGSALWGLEKLL